MKIYKYDLFNTSFKSFRYYCKGFNKHFSINHKILGVKEDASKEEIKDTYYRLAKIYHPDLERGNEMKFAEINRAYEQLMKEQTYSLPAKTRQGNLDDMLNNILKDSTGGYKESTNNTKSNKVDYNNFIKQDSTFISNEDINMIKKYRRKLNKLEIKNKEREALRMQRQQNIELEIGEKSTQFNTEHEMYRDKANINTYKKQENNKLPVTTKLYFATIKLLSLFGVCVFILAFGPMPYSILLCLYIIFLSIK